MAPAVGQFFAHVSRLGVPAVGRLCATCPSFWLVPYGVALGVGYSFREYEEPFTAVRRADLLRSEQIPFRIVPAFGQVAEDTVESSRSESCDVFHENEAGSYLANDSRVLGPETRPLSVETGSGSRKADVLAREAARDEIHDSSPRLAVEGGYVVPDRSWTQLLLSHPGHESRRSVGVPLDVTDSSVSGDGSVQSEFEATDPGK